MSVPTRILVLLHLLAAPVAAGHALLFKRDPRAAWGWITACILFPLAGPLLYFFFGINRIKTRARKLEQKSPFRIFPVDEQTEDPKWEPTSNTVERPEFEGIARISEAVTRRPLVGGNRIEMLKNGEEAYPAMLAAIDGARQTLFLSTYIFDTDATGRKFIGSLAGAAERGVDVRVLIDGIGERYAFPRSTTLLKRTRVRTARFLPPTLIPPSLYINLRNHRKIMVADGQVGFVGGMNIGGRHLSGTGRRTSRVIDMHFRLKGPVVPQIEAVFLEDWCFATGEQTLLPRSVDAVSGDATCRTVVDGPNEDLDKLATILVGVVSAARERVLIMTPYFLPTREMIGALQTAALRGLQVIVVLPSKSNLPFVKWATSNMLWQLLQRGVRVFFQPPPFVHTKLFVVDGYYAQVGSANIDPRSLRLNFELTLEIYDPKTVEPLAAHVIESTERSREVTLEEVDNRPLQVRLRDAIAWLFTPYL